MFRLFTSFILGMQILILNAEDEFFNEDYLLKHMKLLATDDNEIVSNAIMLSLENNTIIVLAYPRH